MQPVLVRPELTVVAPQKASARRKIFLVDVGPQQKALVFGRQVWTTVCGQSFLWVSLLEWMKLYQTKLSQIARQLKPSKKGANQKSDMKILWFLSTLQSKCQDFSASKPLRTRKKGRQSAQKAGHDRSTAADQLQLFRPSTSFTVGCRSCTRLYALCPCL